MNNAKIVCSNTMLKSFYAVLDEVNSAKNDFFTQNIILVPDNFTLNAEKLFFEYTNAESSFNVEVMSLTRLVKKVTQEKLANYEILNQNSAILIITKILLDNSEKFGLIKNAFSSTIAEEFYQTIMQLKSSGITPAEVCTKSANANLKLKLADIKFVYQEYEDYIKDKSLDSADLLDAFSAQVKYDNFANSASVYVAMFDSFSFKQLDAISSIARVCKKFTIALSATTLQGNKHVYLNETLHQVLNAFDKKNIHYQIENISKKLDNRSEFLAKNLFSYAKKDKILNDNIVLCECSSEQEEVDYTARQIKNLAINHKVDFKKIFVACAGLESYKQDIRKIFDYYSIPFYMDEQVSLSDNFFGRFILNILDIFESNYDKIYVLNHLKNPLACEENIDDYINYVDEFGINNTQFLALDGNFDDFKQKYLFPLKNLHVALKNAENIGEMIEMLEQFIDSNNCKEKLDVVAENSKLDVRRFGELSQSYEKAQQGFDLLSNFLGANKADLSYFKIILQNLFASIKIKTVPLGVNTVFVGDSALATFYPSDYLFVLNASDGSLPSYKNDCGLINDSEILELSSSNILSPSIKFTNKVAKYRLFELILSCKGQLSISFASLCYAKPNRPSEIFLELSKLFKTKNGQNISTIKISNEVDYLRLSNAGAKEYIATISSFSHAKNMVSKDFEGDKNLSITKNILFNLTQTKERRHKLSCDAGSLFFDKKSTSVSQIERYFNCPFEHFVRYGLKIRERKIYGIKSVDVGNFLHRVAELFVNFLRENNFTFIDDDIKKIIEKVKKEQKVNFVNAEKLKFENLASEAFDACKKIALQIENSAFKPIFAEKNFESEDYSNKVKIVGKIDRIDEFSGTFLIFDYKTGSKSDFCYQDVYYGKKIQIILYLSILENLLKSSSVGAFYFSIKNRFSDDKTNDKASGVFSDSSEIIKNIDVNLSGHAKSKFFKIEINKDGTLSANASKFALSGAEFLALKNYVKNLFNNALGEILDGYIDPKPSENACKNCKYRLICGYDEKLQGARKMQKDICKITFLGEKNE